MLANIALTSLIFCDFHFNQFNFFNNACCGNIAILIMLYFSVLY